MRPHLPSTPPTGLLPAGERWGLGARTVLPYLVHSLQMRSSAAEVVLGDAQPIRNPVFRGMDLQVGTVASAAGR